MACLMFLMSGLWLLIGSYEDRGSSIIAAAVSTCVSYIFGFAFSTKPSAPTPSSGNPMPRQVLALPLPSPTRDKERETDQALLVLLP